MGDHECCASTLASYLSISALTAELRPTPHVLMELRPAPIISGHAPPSTHTEHCSAPPFHPSVFPPARPLIRVGYYAKLRVATVHPEGVLYVRMFVTFGGGKEVVTALSSMCTTAASGQSM